MSEDVISESSLSEMNEKWINNEMTEQASSQCPGTSIQKHQLKIETFKNGVFHEDFRHHQSFEPSPLFHIPLTKKQLSQKQPSEISQQQSINNYKLSNKYIFQKSNDTIHQNQQDKQKSNKDKQLQDQFQQKKIFDFKEIKNDQKNGELNENKNEKQIYCNILSPQPTKYQKIGRNDEDRGEPICPSFQIEESNILKVNQNITNIPSKIRTNVGQKKQLDIYQKQDHQDTKFSQNIDNQMNFSTRNQKQFERNGKNFILKKQSQIVQKLLNQNNCPVDLMVEKQRLNVQKENKYARQVDSLLGQKQQINIDDESNQQLQELKIPVIDKNNEENDSHKSNSNRKSDQSLQNQNCEINAFTYQLSTDLDDQKFNASKFNSKNQYKIINILDKTNNDKFKEQLIIDEQQSNLKDIFYQNQKSQCNNEMNESMSQSIYSFNTFVHQNDHHQNQSCLNENNNNLKSPPKCQNRNDDGVKKTNHHPTDPQAERIVRTSKEQYLLNQLKKNQSSHESSSTQDISRASELQQSILNSSNNLPIFENQQKFEKKQQIFDFVSENEETNGYNHSFSSKQFFNANNLQINPIELLPKCQKMNSDYINDAHQKHDLILLQGDKKEQNCIEYQKFNLNRIGDGLLQQQNQSPSIDFIDQSNNDIDMDKHFIIKRNSFGRSSDISGINKNLFLEKFEIQIKSRHSNKIKGLNHFQKIKETNLIKSNENIKISAVQSEKSENAKNIIQSIKEQKGCNDRDDSDRFIPIRVCDETINEIFNIQITNNHEQALINKLQKIKKQISGEQLNDLQITQNQSSQNFQNRQLDNRGLQQNEINEMPTSQNEQNFHELLIGTSEYNIEDINLQVDNRLPQEDRAQQISDFNNTFFQTIIQRRQSQRQQEQVNQNLGMLLQQAGVSRVANASESTNPLDIYQNIFGVQNSYDQVIKQVTQNAISTYTLPAAQSQSSLYFEGGPILNDYQQNLLNENQNNTRNESSNGANNQCNSHKNHAQEEKDLELNKNISNYNNLIEQNLLLKYVNIKNNENISCIDTTPSSNLIMTNLTYDSIQSTQGIPFNSKTQALNAPNKPNDNSIQAANNIPIYNQQSSIPVHQKSILGGKILKFKSKDKSQSQSLGINKDKGQKKFYNKQTYDYDYNMNGFINCDQIFLNERNQNIEESVVNTVRKIPSNPYRILEAPGLCDDFYLNLVDWSSQNLLAVALESSVFVWNATTSTVQELCDLGQADQVTSLSWSQKGSHLSVGTKSGQVQIWDINAQKKVRSLEGHFARVSSLAWNNMNSSIVASGSKDRSILIRDLRAHNNQYMKLMDHKQEVCGLRWSLHDENQLASGGNDNQLFIWSDCSDQPLAKFSDHQAAVKAINWSPLHRGLLATGGGTADQCIRFWNTINLSSINCINTGSQVCNLVFSKTNDELVSTHGYSLNQVIVWKYPTMEKIATLTGHTFRVLYLAMNPDGSSIVTGAGDERLRFWNIFPKARSSKIGPLGGLNVVGSVNSSLYPSNLDIR